MATVAVFLALGGVATAAFTLPKKSVGPKQLKANAVTAPKIAAKAVTEGKIGDGSVTNAKLANAAVTESKIAGGQVIKDIVLREVVEANIANNSFGLVRPECASGEFAIAGGGGFTVQGTRVYSNLDTATNMGALAPIDSNDDASTSIQNATGWMVAAQNVAGATRDLHGYVICAKK
jgi:hypothetical protein